ncbi:conserved hypothetical protein [Candidatus Nitrosotenuis uzonensis]|uniref:Uncharacterized protein n=1 Tax=Candidatus Nitrosotenuis uzonensis TaxID=1407055 RepID=V6AUG5_9ARCH|nr:conserved hypothetical protein [Candidatus Nitrosotenuis uzonensis]CDI06516.1 hypothetical protein NITUZ_60043 [Candidatus Nitrosotenuis uzonensis]
MYHTIVQWAKSSKLVGEVQQEEQQTLKMKTGLEKNSRNTRNR